MSYDRRFISVVAIFSVFMAVILVLIQSSIGIYYWDIFLYVNNAMKMAHLGPGDALYLAPFFPAVLALLFRVGFTGDILPCGAGLPFQTRIRR